MIHTDGTPTIANYRAPESVDAGLLFVDDTEEDALMLREHSGLKVALRWIPSANVTCLSVTVGEHRATAIVPKARTLDAFEHPMCYLSDEQVASLFPRAES